MNALELHGLEKHYPDFALGPIDLELPGGTVCGLIGENGAGKSTTIKLILDMIDGDAGTVKLFGQEGITPLAKADIGVVLGVKGEAKGYVTLVLSDKLRTLLKMIPLPRKMSKTPDQVEEFNVYAYVKQLIDGNDVSVLLGVADEVVKVMDTLKFYIPTLKDMSMGLKLSLELIRRYLPEGAFSRIYLDEQPVDSGSYVAGAVALESGDLNTAGVAMFKIKPKTNGVRMYWAQQAEKPMTAVELQSFNEAAVLEVDGQVVPTDKIRYSYKKSGWGCDATSELPTEPGTYVQTAEIGGNYSCSKISRNITVK